MARDTSGRPPVKGRMRLYRRTDESPVQALPLMLQWMLRAVDLQPELLLIRLDDGSFMERLQLELAEWFPELDSLPLQAMVEAITAMQLPTDCSELRYVNAGVLQRALGLSAVEKDLLLYASINMDSPCFREFMRSMQLISYTAADSMLAHVTGHPVEAVAAVLQPGHFLCKGGILLNAHCEGSVEELVLDPRIDAVFASTGATVQMLRQEYLRRPPAPDLRLSDFEHVRQDLDVVLPYLQQALGGQTGANILITGQPGTGKSELAGLIARGCGARLLALRGYTSDESFAGRSRMHTLEAAWRILSCARHRAFLLWDDDKDAFDCLASGIQAVSGPLAWRLLETNPVPGIWICRNASEIGASTLALFDYIINLDNMPAKAVKRLMQRGLGVGQLPAGRIDTLAGLREVTPDMVRKATTVVSLADLPPGQRASALEQLLVNRLRAADVKSWELDADNVKVKNKYRAETPFDVAFCNTSTPLERVVDMLQKSGEGRFCLYGLPGTGKTAFVHHVGEQLGRKVLCYSASDLLDRWVGVTEQNIAEAFEAARKANGILLLDEVDSLLSSREGRMQNWEATQITELLVQMERFHGIFFAATNLKGVLDAAAIRRFDWKIEFQPLKPEQAWQLFLRSLGRREGKVRPKDAMWREPVMGLAGLVPADFGVAMRKFRIAGEGVEAGQLLAWVKEELAHRQTGGRAIGFIQ